jgi:predicted NBD/HSP70 family sugar kinase
VHLFVGNVVDAAFATGGTVHHGPQSAAGAVAHLPLDGRTEPCRCGRHGCFQAAVSSRAVARRAARAGVIAAPSFPALLAAARAGDQRAVEVFRDRARLVGAAAALLLDLLNPEVLVVTEAGTAYLPGCLELLRDEVRSRSAGAGAGAGAGARAGAGAGDPGGSVVATSFGTDALPMAGGAVILDAVYATPLDVRAAVSCAS